jgi:hypothetical protein
MRHDTDLTYMPSKLLHSNSIITNITDRSMSLGEQLAWSKRHTYPFCFIPVPILFPFGSNRVV